MNQYQKLKNKYPGYFRKIKGWEKRQELINNKRNKENKDINLQIFNYSANRLDENINKLFKLL